MLGGNMHQRVIRNVCSNYVRIGLRLVLGLVMFRMLYQGLDKEEFGFWALLWSVFGYGVLIDFGFGLTVQKQVAELSAKTQWDRLSQVLSTIFFVYCGMAILVVAGGILGSESLIRLFQVTPAHRDEFREILTFFLAAMGIGLPLGIFPEILRGQQRIHTANNIAMVGAVAGFASQAIVLHFDYGLKVIILVTLTCTLLPHLIAAVLALANMPKVKIRWSLFCPSLIGQTTRFSLYAYLITLSYMILTKTDQVVIGSFLTMSAVALYQPGAKAGEMFGTITRQIADALQPAAAHLHALGDRKGLQNLILSGIRFSIMLATPLYIGCAYYLDTLLELITGENVLFSETWWVGQVLILWSYSFIITHNVYKRIAVMSGKEKVLVQIGLAEAGLNLGLSMGLIILFQSVLGVAVATLVSSLICGWGFLWGWAAQETAHTGWQLARKVLFRNWFSGVPLLVFLMGIECQSWFDTRENLTHWLGVVAASGIVAALGVWHIALTWEERETVRNRFALILGKWAIAYRNTNSAI